MLSTLVCMHGKCRESVDLYREAFGAEVIQFIPNHEDEQLIDHAEIRIHDTVLMLNDFGYSDADKPSNGYMLSVRFETVEELTSAYERLIGGGRVLSPMAAWDYTPCQVVFTDRYDVRWGFWV